MFTLDRCFADDSVRQVGLTRVEFALLKLIEIIFKNIKCVLQYIC